MGTVQEEAWAVDTAVQTLRQWVAGSKNIVFFGGAGVSTESGIPDFRSVDGLYNQQWAYPPETILSHSFFERDPAEFYRFYRAKLVVKDAKPNAAGSREVLELHGSTLRCYCARCRKSYPPSFINDGEGVPRCGCGGIVRPDVVLYEEPLDEDILQRSVMHIRAADMLIIGGTSLAVYPAAGLINYYRGSRLVLVNRGATPRDAEADLIVRGNIGQIFSQL